MDSRTYTEVIFRAELFNMSNMLSLVKTHTADFFGMHWNSKYIRLDVPRWSEPWRLLGQMPNHDKQGVYVFVKGDFVTYIGSGVASIKGRYKGHGLGKRIYSYLRVLREGEYYAVDSRLQDADYLITLGFPEGYGYMAIALEYYLLTKLTTEHNKNRPGR